ncbi:hypothetical protein KC909_03230, partial [Candidatus Dojkabacteria bacterium]|nr:hypothetical protein [Candidatus Dojkabacteria bacterium]
AIRKIDADGDSSDELIVTQNTAYFNGIYRAGIVYYVDDVVINSAKNISLKDTDNYAFRIGGEGTNGFANANILDRPNSRIPLVITSNQPTAKRFYVSMDKLNYLKGQAQKEYDIAVDTDWYDATFINYDCVRASSRGDYLNDNNIYEIFNVCWAGNNGTNTGSSYLVNDNFMGQGFSGTNVDLSNIINDQGIVRWDGDNEGGTYFGQNTFTPQDINNDSKNDFVFQNDWTDYHGARSGSAYIILNYPHTISLGQNAIFNTSTPEMTGTVNADLSVTDISMVEYSVDNSSFNANWKQCGPSDGVYNSNTEAFKCILDSIPDGNHTVYFRSYDAMGSYTAQNHYAKKDITVDTTPPNPVITKIGQIGNIPVLDSLYYYYTANSVIISGTSEVGSVVTFTFDGQSYTATTDSNGNFVVQIPYLPDGTDILKYSAVDKAGNVSKTKSLTLIIPCYNFPEELQNIYCPAADDADQGEDVDETEPVLIEILEGELPETGNETSQILVKIIDEDGNIISGIEVIIGGQSYITDEQGYIYLDVDYGDYDVKINYGGEQLSYNLEINSNEETVQVILDEVTGNNLYYVCCCVILIAVLIFFFILFWKRKKEEDEEEQAEKNRQKE